MTVLYLILNVIFYIVDAKDAVPKLEAALLKLDEINEAMQERVDVNGTFKSLLECLPTKLQDTFHVVHSGIKNTLSSRADVSNNENSPRNSSNVPSKGLTVHIPSPSKVCDTSTQGVERLIT